MGSSRLVNRNVIALNGRTSMRLEPEIWDALRDICLREQVSLGALIQRIEQSHLPGARTSAVRVHVLRYFRLACTETGHAGAGHGPSPSGRVPAEVWPVQRLSAAI